jgi:hypothetical protein
MQQTWQQLLTTPPTASGTAIASSTTETILVPNTTVYANQMVAGTSLRLWAFGGYGTTGTPTLTFAVRWGGVSGTVLAKTGAITTGSAVGGGASMTALFALDLTIQCRTAGSSGTFMTNGTLNLFSTGTAAGSEYPIVSGSTGGTTPATATVDTTADTALSLTALWGTSNAANSIQLHQMYIDSLN